MTEFSMLYLILVCAGFVGFVSTLAYGMMQTSRPDVGTHARTEQRHPLGAVHQRG